MALIQCSECGQMISDKARTCPNCGNPMVVSGTDEQEATIMRPGTYPEPRYYENNEEQPKRINPWLIAAIVAGVLALLAGGYWLLSGNNSEKKVKELLERLSQAANSNDRSTLESIYPDARYAETLKFTYHPEGTTIVPNAQGDTIIVKFNDGTDLTVAGKDDLRVISSHGLFVWPQANLEFAKGTGWLDEKLTDVENSHRMAHKDFPQYLLEQFNENLKKGLKLTNKQTYGDQYIDDNHEDWACADGWIFTVSNNTPYDIPASAYSITVKSGYWGGGKMATEIVPGKDIQSGGTVTLRTRTQAIAPNLETDGSETLVVKGLTMEEFMSQYHPTGNEYKDYLAKHGAVTQSAETLDFVLEGVMGGCGARLTHNTDAHKYLQYNPNGKSLDDLSENRDVSITTYEPSTGHLVMQVMNGYTKTGVLDGIYKNGTYTGQFKSVNGSSSAFSFK